MPSNRRLKATGLIVLIVVLVVLYVTNGAKSTRNSPFYTKTVEAITQRQQKDALDASELERKQRDDKIRKEHEAAVAAVVAADDEVSSDAEKAAGLGSLGTGGEKGQQPLADDLKKAAANAKDAVTGASQTEAEKSVAGRKMMKDDKVVVNHKGEGDDGVAKVGNVGPKVLDKLKPGPETEEDHKVEIEMESILKKGPIIIFSKSYW